jgi:hypothetical protein
MLTNRKVLWGILALLALGALPRRAAAQFETDHVARAQGFLRSQAKNSLGFIQMGCTLKGVNTDHVKRHADGTFTVGVRYGWSGLDNGNDHTDVYYTFNARGRLTGLQVGDTTAIVFTPYSVADGVIQVLRDALQKELQNADEATRNLFGPLLRQANAQTIHRLTLQLQQSR